MIAGLLEAILKLNPSALILVIQLEAKNFKFLDTALMEPMYLLPLTVLHAL
jgi:D-arabinose 5-phosphate isomerase GutQ